MLRMFQVFTEELFGESRVFRSLPEARLKPGSQTSEMRLPRNLSL
jgi:hypothetical protein